MGSPHSQRQRRDGRRLGAEIELIREILGQVLDEQEGRSRFRRAETLRRATEDLRRRYDSEKEQALQRELRALPAEDLDFLARSFLLFMHLVNVCEVREEVRAHPEQPGFYARRSFQQLREEGIAGVVLRRALRELSATVVLTAHPTDATRWTVHSALHRIEGWIERTQSRHLSDLERQRAREQLLRETTALWQTAFIPHRKPTPIDEVRHAVHRLEGSIFTAVPQVAQVWDRAWREVFEEEPPRVGPILRLGSWIGGDRDGNPFVTATVTTEALRLYRQAVLTAYSRRLPELVEVLTSSHSQVPVSAALQQHVQDALERSQSLRNRVEGRNPDEVYRTMVNLVTLRLAGNLRENDALGPPGEFGGYAGSEEFRRDLDLMDRSLRENLGERLAGGELSSLRVAAEAFGFEFVSLDVRQHEARHRHAVSELFCPVEGPFESLPLERRQEFLEHLALMEADELPPDELLSADAREVIETLRGIGEAFDRGHDAICDLVVSNAEDSSAVLELLVLARHAGLIRRLPEGRFESRVNLVPLFESVDALERSADSMERLYESPAYREQLEARGSRQQIMLGYSDSAKDGGYLAAAFALQLAQWKLARQAREHGVQLEFFHGRGGAIGRGGGPTHRAILSQPPGTVSGRIKVTEQGEVIATKYGSVAQACHHLERFLVATFEASLAMERETGHRPPKRIWIRAMEELAEESRAAYRSLVYETPGFVDFFQLATPIDAISRLRIGSRPARRVSSGRIEDLRAIPWTFAWNQSRLLLSGWYGAGTAFAAYTSKPGNRRSPSLKQIYQGWPFFRNVIDNLEQVLAKVDLHIAERYAAMAGEASDAKALMNRIRREYRLAVRGVRAAKETPRLLARDPGLRRSLSLRMPYLDALSYLQLELLRRSREGMPDDRLADALQLTIGGVAAGLRNTG